MITKDNNFKNKYILNDSSTGDDFQEVWKSYKKVNCLICNKNTAKRFKPSLWAFGESCLTINNKIPDDVFFINSVF